MSLLSCATQTKSRVFLVLNNRITDNHSSCHVVSDRNKEKSNQYLQFYQCTCWLQHHLCQSSLIFNSTRNYRKSNINAKEQFNFTMTCESFKAIQQTWKDELFSNISLRFSCDSCKNYNRRFVADNISCDLLKNYHEQRSSNFEKYWIVSKIETCFRDSSASIEFRMWCVHQHEWTNSMFANREDELRHDENVSNLELKINQQIISTYKDCLWTIRWFRIFANRLSICRFKQNHSLNQT